MINKLLIAIVIFSFLLLGNFFVTAVVMNKDSKTIVGSNSESPQALRLLQFNDKDTEQESEVDDDSNEKEDAAITGSALERASAAALNYIGEGRVTDTEIGDEEGYYEIEVTLDNGKKVDVHLDKDFNFLSEESDSDNENDED